MDWASTMFINRDPFGRSVFVYNQHYFSRRNLSLGWMNLLTDKNNELLYVYQGENLAPEEKISILKNEAPYLSNHDGSQKISFKTIWYDSFSQPINRSRKEAPPMCYLHSVETKMFELMFKTKMRLYSSVQIAWAHEHGKIFDDYA